MHLWEKPPNSNLENGKIIFFAILYLAAVIASNTHTMTEVKHGFQGNIPLVNQLIKRIYLFNNI